LFAFFLASFFGLYGVRLCPALIYARFAVYKREA
jgi:hypothetical protein